MTLENFFTESELKNGLTIPVRVNELVTILQRQKDSLVDNLGQLSIVANTIAATENSNSLELFVQLDGVVFIDKWLKDAQKLKNDNESEFSEKLIVSLFKALERMKIDNVSEIGKTVQNLVAYGSIAVSEKAKELSDKWMLIRDYNVASKDEKSSELFSSEIVETETENQEPLDRVDKSTDDVGDLLVKLEVPNSKSEEILEMSTYSFKSSIKTDELSDKDVGVEDSESPKTSSNSESGTESGNANDGVQSNGNLENRSQGFKLSINRDKSDMELDYGMIDPLDIARQVANEVEQDVDSRERSCSTSDSKSDHEIISQSQSQLVKEVELEPVKESKGPVSQISEIAQESEPDTGRLFPGFDLNEEALSDEDDNPVNPVNTVTSAISAGSASQTAFRAEFPASPLQFNLTREKSNQQSDFLDFDLNVADDDDEGKMVILPRFHSEEESCIANLPKPKLKRLLDLNSTDDENAVIQNGWQSPYDSSSSSSSSKHSILRKNFDLNLTEQPVFPNSGDSVSIFSTKAEVKKTDYVPRLDFSYGNPNPFFYLSSSHVSHMPTPAPMLMSYMGDSGRFLYVPQFSSVGPQHNLNLKNGGLREFFPQNSNEEGSSSSSVLGKRREPDSSWECIPVNKHLQPPWR